MLLRSFRVAPSRLLAVSLAATIFAGCGGSGGSEPTDQLVSGPGFSFSAPAGWQVSTGKRQASATHDSELVQVAAFPLLRPYSNALFAKVERELKARMQQVAA